MVVPRLGHPGCNSKRVPTTLRSFWLKPPAFPGFVTCHQISIHLGPGRLVGFPDNHIQQLFCLLLGKAIVVKLNSCTTVTSWRTPCFYLLKSVGEYIANLERYGFSLTQGNHPR